MEKPSLYLEYVKNSILAPEEYFQDIKEREVELRDGAIVAVISTVLYGLLEAIRSVIRVNIGALKVGVSGIDLLTLILRNTLSGFLILLISATIIFLIVHPTVKLMGRSGWKNTFTAIAYATPVFLLTGTLLIVYQLFQSLLGGFSPALYIGLAAPIIYTAYVEAKGLEALHEMSFRKAFKATMIPVVLLAIVLATYLALLMVAVLSML